MKVAQKKALTLRLRLELYEAVKEKARLTGTSIADQIALAVAEYLKVVER